MKPHRGRIEDWVQSKCIGGSIIVGTCVDHPQFGTSNTFHTSLLVSNDGHEIETLNSRYTLGTPRELR